MMLFLFYLCFWKCQKFFIKILDWGFWEKHLSYQPMLWRLLARIPMMPQPSVAGSSREKNWPVVLGTEGWHTFSPLSIWVTLANHSDLWAHIWKWRIALSSKCVTLSFAFACATIQKDDFGLISCVWEKAHGSLGSSLERQHFLLVAVMW